MIHLTFRGSVAAPINIVGQFRELESLFMKGENVDHVLLWIQCEVRLLQALH